MTDSRAIAEAAARESYGRLLAWLTARSRDVTAAEDALADAFSAALEHWPRTGAPDNPEAWLLTAARRKLIDQGRRTQTKRANDAALVLASEESEAAQREDRAFPDERLKLLFVCAHPAIDAAIRTPLMLQTVLGLDAERIASAFLVAPKTMSQRLVRAKRKIRDAGIPFDTPGPADFDARLHDVLQAIYAAYTAGWDASDGFDARCSGLTREAIFLSRLIVSMTENAAEAYGLCALILHAEARRPARIVDGAYVPLDAQDTRQWDRAMINEAEILLMKAWRLGAPGRFQIEAAIQSAHAAARLHGRDTKDDIITLYERLNDLAPSIGALVGYAGALCAADRHADGLAALDAIEPKRVIAYQSYWAVRAHLLDALGQAQDARDAYRRAIGLCEEAAARDYLQAKIAALA